VKRQEQLNQVKSKKMGVKDIINKDRKSPPKAKVHSNERDGKMNIVSGAISAQRPTLQLDEEEPEVEMSRGLLIIP